MQVEDSSAHHCGVWPMAVLLWQVFTETCLNSTAVCTNFVKSCLQIFITIPITGNNDIL